MTKEEFDPEDPMELVGVLLPGGDQQMMAECIVEEFIRNGASDEELWRIFRLPFYAATHALYRERGEEYIGELIGRMRAKWGYWKICGRF